MKALRFTLVLFPILLGGCDAWPTVIDNRSGHDIRFRYQASGREDWSAEFDLPAGEARRLAREHWVQNVEGFVIGEGQHRYTVGHAALAPARHSCPSSSLSRRLKFAPDCYLTYHGQGRFTASFTAPPDIAYHQLQPGE